MASKGDARRATMPRTSFLEGSEILSLYDGSKELHHIELLKLFSHPSKAEKLEDFIEDLEGNGHEEWRSKWQNLFPKRLLEVLRTSAGFVTKVTRVDVGEAGNVAKFIMKLHDGYDCETVVMAYGKTDRGACRFMEADGTQVAEPDRFTICLSCQVGCRMGCSFCATGSMGLKASLTCGEILEQFVHVSRWLMTKGFMSRITNVVFMGMGEPLDNLEEVARAADALIDRRFFNLAPAKVTVSTVGITKGIIELKERLPLVSLALSLHASSHEKREYLMPTARHEPLSKVLSACREFVENQHSISSSRRKKASLFLEYILISKVNDTVEDAVNLAIQLNKHFGPFGDSVYVNLIPYNPTDAPIARKRKYKRPTDEDTRKFIQALRERGITALARQTIGDDIEGACGQLVLSEASRLAAANEAVRIDVDSDEDWEEGLQWNRYGWEGAMAIGAIMTLVGLVAVHARRRKT